MTRRAKIKFASPVAWRAFPQSTQAEFAAVGLPRMLWVDLQDVDPMVAQVLDHIEAQTDIR